MKLKLFTAMAKYSEYTKYVFANDWEDAKKLLIEEHEVFREGDDGELVARWDEDGIVTEEFVSLFKRDIERGAL